MALLFGLHKRAKVINWSKIVHCLCLLDTVKTGPGFLPSFKTAFYDSHVQIITWHFFLERKTKKTKQQNCHVRRSLPLAMPTSPLLISARALNLLLILRAPSTPSLCQIIKPFHFLKHTAY